MRARTSLVCRERSFVNLPKRARRGVIHAFRINRRGILNASELTANTPRRVVDSFLSDEHILRRQDIQIRDRDYHHARTITGLPLLANCSNFGRGRPRRAVRYDGRSCAAVDLLQLANQGVIHATEEAGTIRRLPIVNRLGTALTRSLMQPVARRGDALRRREIEPGQRHLGGACWSCDCRLLCQCSYRHRDTHRDQCGRTDYGHKP